MTEISVTDLVFDEAGLIPAIAQEQATGQVLMVAWMNRQAFEETQASGEATFWSRSRGEIWRKGATSGNRLRVQSIAADCDRDTLLLNVTADGPACHEGTTSCFPTARSGRFGELDDLWATIQQRLAEPAAGSYTVRLVGGGPQATGRKVLEEAAEAADAALRHERGLDGDQRVIEEAADVLYHALVLLAEREISPTDVMDELRRRRAPHTT